MIWPVPTQVGKTVKQFTGLFYGWRMVAAASAVRVLGAGLHSYGFTVFFLPLSRELNLSRTATSFAFSLSRAEGAIEGPIVGHLLDRYGPRPGDARRCPVDGRRVFVAFTSQQLRRLFDRLYGTDFTHTLRRFHACANGVDQHLVYSSARSRDDYQ